jgi:hypothetical protein
MDQAATAVTQPVKDLILSLGFPVVACLWLMFKDYMFSKKIAECLERIAVSMAQVNDKLPH